MGVVRHHARSEVMRWPVCGQDGTEPEGGCGCSQRLLAGERETRHSLGQRPVS
jgi:hypothetical protein